MKQGEDGRRVDLQYVNIPMFSVIYTVITESNMLILYHTQ